MIKLLEEIKQIKTGDKELKNFGLLVGGIFIAFGLLMLWRGKPHFTVPIVIGTPLVILGVITPRLLKQIYLAWMSLGFIMGAIVAPIILTLLYFFGITPIGLLGRLTGKEFLDLKFKIPADSYWIPKAKRDPQKSSETQF